MNHHPKKGHDRRIARSSRNHLPASSKWPLDNSNGGHFSPLKRSLKPLQKGHSEEAGFKKERRKNSAQPHKNSTCANGYSNLILFLPNLHHPQMFGQSLWPSFSLHCKYLGRQRGHPDHLLYISTCLQEDSFQLLRSQAVILMIRRLFWGPVAKTGGNERQRSKGDLKHSDFKRKQMGEKRGV